MKMKTKCFNKYLRMTNSRCCTSLSTLLQRGKFFVKSNNKKINLSKEFNIMNSILNNNKRDGTLFEKQVASIFRKNKTLKVISNGASIKNTLGDGGIDIWLLNKINNQKYIVQCKNYSHTIGPKDIREFAGILKESKHNEVTKGYFVTSSKFSSGAVKFATEFNEEKHGKEIILCDYNWYRLNINHNS